MLSWYKKYQYNIYSKSGGASNVINGDMDYCVDDDKSNIRPSTPPSRLEAFELFKKGRGKELKRIFLQNKGTVRSY